MTEPECVVVEGEEKPEWKPPARNTIHNEFVTPNMVLKTAQCHK